MDRERQRQIASAGGRAAHAQGTAHEFTPEEAREAGRKGGEASRAARLRRAGGQSSEAGETSAECENGTAHQYAQAGQPV
jgi:hypothetical protein